MLRGQFLHPVDTGMPRDAYIAACEVTDAEAYYRTADSRVGQKVAVTLTVREAVTDVEGSYRHERYPNYYLCSDAEQTFVILVRDCVLENRINLLPGDVVTFYGEGAGNMTVTDTQYNTHTAPCINAAFAVLNEQP